MKNQFENTQHKRFTLKTATLKTSYYEQPSSIVIFILKQGNELTILVKKI
jgi:hypothetical protein